MEARRCLRITPDDVEFEPALILDLSLKVGSSKTAVGKDDLDIPPPRLFLARLFLDVKQKSQSTNALVQIGR